ncbi:MAG: CRISPR-associated endonuclease Cas3'' [Ruminococcus sp.]
MLHDLGKYSKEFQRKIQNDTGERVDHSTAGAKVCNEKGGYYSILSYCIAGHHAGLPDYGNTAISNSLCGRCKKESVISKIIKMKYKFQCFIQIRLFLIQLKI